MATAATPMISINGDTYFVYVCIMQIVIYCVNPKIYGIGPCFYPKKLIAPWQTERKFGSSIVSPSLIAPDISRRFPL